MFSISIHFHHQGRSTVGHDIGIVIAPKHHSLGGVILIRDEKLQELQESGPNISEKEAGGFCEGWCQRSYYH